MHSIPSLNIPKKYVDRVLSVDHDEDGWWIFLHDGWCWQDNGLHTIHEDYKAAALCALRETAACECADCMQEAVR